MTQLSRLPKGLLFLGTDTDVGKTYLCVEFIRAMKVRKVDLGVYKPVASGIPLVDPQSDASRLLKAAELDDALLSRVCPQSFATPLAPPAAAAAEGKSVDEAKLLAGAQWWFEHCQFLVVEGVGGVMSPISSSMTALDFGVKLGLPVVLVAANRLGCVSHVLLAAEAIQRRKLKLLAVVLNELPRDNSTDGFFSVENTPINNCSLIDLFLPNIPLVKSAREITSLLE